MDEAESERQEIMEKQGFEGWLAKVKFALWGAGLIKDDETLHADSWKSMYYNDKIQPYKAVEMDMQGGIIVPYFYRALHHFTELEHQ